VINIKNKEFLNFDTWRKKGHKELLLAYVKAFEKNDQISIKEGLKDALNMYTSVGAGTYDGSIKKWNSAYTISRELAIYKQDKNGNHTMSVLAQNLINSEITPSEYIANYILNFNQLINGEVIHPLYEILLLIENNNIEFEQGQKININQITGIPLFGFSSTVGVSTDNAENMAKNFCRRINDSTLMIYDEIGQILSFNLYKVDELKVACIIWDGTIEEFKKMDQNDYVDMICKPNPFIYERTSD